MALFMFRGTGSAFFLPANIDTSDGISADMLEAEGAIDLTDAINGMTGFEPSSSPINVPVLRSRQSLQIPGERTFGNPQIVLVEDDGVDVTAQARQLALQTLEADVAGTLVIFRNTQDPEVGDTYYKMKVAVDSQVPSFTLDAAAATTAINLAPQEELTKGQLLAAS
jgi:hypothetical protein